LRLAPGLGWAMVDDEAVVVDLPRRRFIGLNPSASFIWARIGSGSEDEIAAELADAFEVDAARARDDVRAFLARLRDRGFLEVP
jgi:Coenzyme PQQ synthesis protein D (PqqD)